MSYLLWSLPIIAIVVCMGSGKGGAISAGACGGLIAIAIAMTAAPIPLSPAEALAASGKGLWLSGLVGIVILTGLFFREIVSGTRDPVLTAPSDGKLSRRRAFAACFLVGPFAECATGFGVGQVATIGMLRGAGLRPLDAVMLGLFSQILVPWGAMANGTVVGAELAGISAHELGIKSAFLSVPLLLVWLVLFWRIVGEAGVEGTRAEGLWDVAWVLSAATLLILANAAFGPEVAGIAALGPLIVLRFWRDERPHRVRWVLALRAGFPYAALIVALVAVRGIPPLTAWLGSLVSIRPFSESPAWIPLLHPGSWLLAIGALTAVTIGRLGAIPVAAQHAWSAGRKAVFTIAIYLVLAELMADSGMADALAGGLRELLGPFSAMTTPLLAGVFGFLTGSSNAANGLLMHSQASLAGHSAVPLGWLAAIQNTAAAALTMLSPARIAMGCALVGQPDLERATYARAWPLGAAAITVLSVAALLFLLEP